MFCLYFLCLCLSLGQSSLKSHSKSKMNPTVKSQLSSNVLHRILTVTRFFLRRQLYPTFTPLASFHSKVEEAMMVLEDDSPMEAASTPSTPRNLSAWNITIPYIDFYDDDVKRERIPVFCIDVERNDRKAGEVRRSRPSVSVTVI